MHTALQLGTVDARSFSTAVETYTLRDVLEANILTNDYFEVAFWLVNKGWWDGLPDDVRNALQAAADSTVAWSYFLGVAYVTRNGEHIHGGILTMVVTNRNTVRAVRLLMSVLSILACMVFGYYAIRYALFEINTGRLSSYMRWPKGWWSASLIFGFTGTVAYMVLQALNQFMDLKSHLRTTGKV